MRNLKRSHVLKGLLCFGVLSLMASNANAISIDNWSASTPSFKATYDSITVRKVTTGDQFVSIIGKNRRVIAKYTSNINNDEAGVGVLVKTSTNVYSHSQDDAVKGYTSVIWDGPADNNYYEEVDSTGLGGINFTTDGSTKFVIKIYDPAPAYEFRTRDNANISLTVYKYNSTQSYEVKKYAKDVTDRTSDSFDLEFLFSEFGGYDFTDVGALVLKIDGQEYEAMDVSLGEIKTDGCQNFVPEPDYGYAMGWTSTTSRDNGDAMTKVCCPKEVIDDCGICNGTGKDTCGFCPGNENYGLGQNDCGDCPGTENYKKEKDECGICPGQLGYEHSKDDCGFCFGTEENKAGKDDCGICPGKEGYNKEKDACKRCYGDKDYGKEECDDCKPDEPGIQTMDRCGECLDLNDPERDSCIDCGGEPFGKKRPDDCGNCNEPLSDAWNSGADALYGCTLQVNSSDLTDTEKWISQQQVNYKALLANRHYCKTDQQKKKLRKQSVAILSSVKSTIKSYPTTTLACSAYDADHCTSYSLKGDNNSLMDSVKKLRKRSLKALNARKNCIGSEQGQCEGSYEACLKRMRNRYRQIREERRNVEQLAKNAKDSINNLPKVASACSCEKL